MRGLGRRLATETKHALKTTEFYAYVVAFVLILIAGNSIESAEGGPDRFAADKVWLYIAILTVGYMISRGLAKAGSRGPTGRTQVRTRPGTTTATRSRPQASSSRAVALRRPTVPGCLLFGAYASRPATDVMARACASC